MANVGARRGAFVLLLAIGCSGPVDTNAVPADASDGVRDGKHCGNGVCGTNETCSTCPADCGVCPDAGTGAGTTSGSTVSSSGTGSGGAGAAGGGSTGSAITCDVFAAPSGSDTAEGTETDPFATIARGIAALSAGKTLCLRAGVYTEPGISYDSSASPEATPAGTSWTAPVTIAAYPGETVTFRPSSGAFGFVFTGSATSYVVVRGFILDAYNVVNDGIKITNASATGSAHHIRVEDMEIENAYGMGILISSTGSNDNELLYLDIHGSGNTSNPAFPAHSMTPAHYHAMYIETSRNLIEHSDLHDNPGCGVHIYTGGDGTADGNVVRFNRAHHNGQWADHGCGIILGSGSNNVAYDNLSYENGSYGIQIQYQGASASPGNDNRAYNNTVWHNGKYGFELGSTVENSILANNIAFANNWSDLDDGGIATVSSHNLFGVDPQLSSPSTGDFHLTSASAPAIDQGIDPATIDTGMPAASVTTDFDGVARPQGSGYDIGAYEFKP